VRLISTLEKPVICSLNGVAAGAGAGLALACDYVIAASEAYLVFSFINVGLVSDSGSSYTLPRLVGKRRAFEMLSLGEKIPATEALALGMINSVVSADELEKATQAIALRYAQMPTKAVAMMKKMLNRSSHSSLDQMLELEMFYQEIAGNSADYQEGVNAFNEKRKPNFTGR
jgi:2-(1,2-epoxy-1,2-dihydrophenyl)acetyl-CoA isomerase